MGIVAKQSTWNLITLFTGVFLGAVNTMLLFPMVLDPDQYGLTRILVTVGILAAQFSMMGMPSILIKFLYKFRKEKGKSYGLLSFVFISCIVGTVVVLIAMYFGKAIILKPYMNNAKSFSEKYYLLFPFVFFITLNGILSQYLKAVFHSVFQLIVSEVIIRLAVSALLITYYFEQIDFDLFMWLFVFVYGFSSLLLFGYLVLIKEFDVKYDKSVLTKENKRSFIKYGIANFFSGIGFRLANMIDVLMIGAMIGALGLDNNGGLKAAAIYSLAAYMSSVIEMPARAIGNIALSLIAKSWAENDLAKIKSLYQKSSINQLVVGGLVFIGVWVNIDSIVAILNQFSKDGYDFSEVKYVVLFLGLGKLFHVASGINGGIIITSKHYLFGTYVTISLIFITFFTNWIFIPVYGIVGAAIATAISLLIFNVISFFFLSLKFSLQPFTFKTLLAILIGSVTLVVVYFIPELKSPFLDIALRSVVVVVIYMTLIFGLKVSEDFNKLGVRLLAKFGIKNTN